MDDSKGHRPDLIFDDGGDMNLLIHEGKKVEYLFLKDGTIPDPSSTDNYEFNIFENIIKIQLEGGEMDGWNKICQYVYESFWGDLKGGSPYVQHGEERP